MPEITRYAQGTPSWVELTTTDDTEAVKFYGSLFGWVNDPQEMGPGSYYHMQQLEGLAAAAIYRWETRRGRRTSRPTGRPTSP